MGDRDRPIGDTGPVSDPGEIEADNLKLVRMHYTAYSSGDVDGIVECLDTGIEITVHDEHGAPEGERIKGKPEARQFFEQIKASVTNSTVEVKEMRADGSRVLASVVLGGTVRATGATGAIPAVHLFTVHEGLITSIRTHRPNWKQYAGDGEETA